MVGVHNGRRWLLVLAVALVPRGDWADEPGKEPRRDEPRIVSVAFAPDGRLLASLSSDRTFGLWDAASGKECKKTRLSLEKGEVPKRVSYTPSGEVGVLVYKYEGFRFNEATGWATQGTISACLWNLTSGKRSPFIEIGYGGVGLDPNGQLLAYGDGLWDVATGKKRRQFTLPGGLIYDIRFSPDGRILAYHLCESLAQNVGVIVLLEVATGKRILQVGEFDWPQWQKWYKFITAPTFSPDGKAIAFTEPDEDAFHLWNVAAAKAVYRIPLANWHSVLGFSADGKMLILWGHDDRTIQLRETATGKLRRSIKLGVKAQCVTLSPDGQTVAVVHGDRVQFHKLSE